MTTAQAYAVCRGIARRQAKNFYFAFLALPAPKRNAICAVYAFMRHADDLSDDESMPLAERRHRLAEWRARWRHAAEQGNSDDPVFRALNDARVRFRIPLALLEQLVDGTAMDLDEEQGASRSFADFAALRRYCYLVASVVGLVCIRIFGYSSPRAEALAEELGIAFQLTNILRDVKEDAERGRVYLPVDELARHGYTPELLAQMACAGHAPDAQLRAMLAEQAERAEALYAAGRALLPLIEPESRPALWVLTSIYHRLLLRIAAADYDVLTERQSVPAREKLWLLARGLAATARARVRGRGLQRTAPRAHVQEPGQEPRRVAIVGAGVAGLSAGCALVSSGHAVTVFERRPYVGGRASSYLHPGSGEVIDNCQHILLGCCTALRGLLAQIGRADAVVWTDSITYIEPGGRQSRIPAAGLPAPLHGMPGFLRARCFSARDKRAIARGLRALLRHRDADVPGGEDFLHWAHRHRQSPGALRRFWEPVLKSALNDDLDRISVHYAAKVMRESFLNSAEAGRMGVPLLPLSEFYAGAQSFIERSGGSVRLRTDAVALEQRGPGWLVRTADGAEQQFDDVILALPFEQTPQLLPVGPVGDPLRAMAAAMEHNPLIGVHLFFDEPFTSLPHAVLLDATIQWMYRQPSRGEGSHIELVISAAKELVRTPQADILALAMRELALFFPEVRHARLRKGVVTKEVRATFAVPPGVDARRPGARTPWPGLYLAGDWTDTGWPATMEGAARSGMLAAEAITGEQLLPPELPPRGLMRLLA